jgi:hypothetical protein
MNASKRGLAPSIWPVKQTPTSSVTPAKSHNHKSKTNSKYAHHPATVPMAEKWAVARCRFFISRTIAGSDHGICPRRVGLGQRSAGDDLSSSLVSSAMLFSPLLSSKESDNLRDELLLRVSETPAQLRAERKRPRGATPGHKSKSKPDASPDSSPIGANAPTDDIATRIMTQMVRMPPKPHEKMKIGKPRTETPDRRRKPK